MMKQNTKKQQKFTKHDKLRFAVLKLLKGQSYFMAESVLNATLQSLKYSSFLE